MAIEEEPITTQEQDVAEESGSPETDIPFEKNLERLESIVRRLEKGDVPLEEALALFEEGIRIARICTKRLDEVEGKIEILLGMDGTAPVVDTFPATVREKED